RHAVETAILDAKGHRLPERGDLGVRPAVLELLRLGLREIAREVDEAGNRVAIRMIVAGEEIELAVGLDGFGRARSDAEVALEARIPVERAPVRFVFPRLEFEIGQHGIDQTVGAELRM